MGSSPQNLQEVSVQVPTDRIAEFYAMYGLWLAEGHPLEAADARSPWDPGKDRDRRAGVIQRRVRSGETPADQ